MEMPELMTTAKANIESILRLELTHLINAINDLDIGDSNHDSKADV